MQQRMMCDPKHHFEVQEPAWHQWQHQLRHQKEEHQQEIAHYQQHQVLAQDELEKREMVRKDPRLFQEMDSLARRLNQDGCRRTAFGVGFHGNQYSVPDTFSYYSGRLGIGSSRHSSGIRESDWRKYDRAYFLNGDYQSHGHPSSYLREEVRSNQLVEAVTRVKVEKSDEDVIPANLSIHHDPAKLRFLEGLGLVTADRKKELNRGGPSLKRKFEVDPLRSDMRASVEMSRGKDSEEISEETASDADSAATSTDTDLNSETFSEKMEFMAKLGLVPPHRRQEMEKSFEIQRSERKSRKSRGRPKKRTRKEVGRGSENNPPTLDLENLTGPITRNRQQLIEEQEQLLSLTHQPLEEKADKCKDQSRSMKSETHDQKSIAFGEEYKERSYQSTDDGRCSVRTVPETVRSPPRLTLKSLTNMEDPFTNSSASNFRPPYLRHTGLLSISKDHAGSIPKASSFSLDETRAQQLMPETFRTDSVGVSEANTRDYLSGGTEFAAHSQSQEFVSTSHFGRTQDCESSTTLKKDLKERGHVEKPTLFQWPGVEAVMQAYYVHASENDIEKGVLSENSQALKSHNGKLSEQAQLLSMQMTNLVQMKRQLLESKRSLRADLDRLHFFVQSFQR